MSSCANTKATRFDLDEKESVPYRAYLQDRNSGAPIPLSSITDARLWLTDEDTGQIINGRDNQLILNANNVIITEGGILTWTIQQEDTAIITPERPAGDRETHRAVFRMTYNGGLVEVHRVYLRIRQYDEFPVS